jgi:hypothetical protein
MPTDGAARTRLARVLGFRGTREADEAEQLDAELRRHQATVRSIHERLYFRPLLEAFSASGGAMSPFLSQFLLLAYDTRSPATGRSLLAFRLHQFIAGTGDLYGTLEPPGVRYLTVNGQQFKPGERDKTLFNLSFCRDCGQEYYPVWATMAARLPVHVTARELTERSHEDDDVLFGYFMPDAAGIFDAADIENGLYPEDWIDFAATPPRLNATYRRYRPLPVSVATDGAIGTGLPWWFIPGSFRFCLQCGIAYDGAMRSDLTKLSSLSSEGRSSATTVLTLSSLRYLLDETVALDPKAKKLLGFT